MKKYQTTPGGKYVLKQTKTVIQTHGESLNGFKNVLIVKPTFIC